MNAINHRGGLALIRGTWLSWMQARGFFFVLAFLWMIPPLISLFVWSAAAGDGPIGGMDPGAFAGYYLVLIVVNQLTYAQTNWTVGDLIRYGGLNPILLRPLAPVYHMLSSEIAGKVVYLAFTVPAALLLGLLLHPTLTITGPNLAPFGLSLLLAWALRFAWGLWLAELAFWAARADALLVIQDSLVFLFSGLVAPVTLLPGSLARWALLLPFRYMVGFPVEVLTGRLAQTEILGGLALQSAWLVIAVALAWSTWRAGVRRYAAIGG